MAKIKDFTLSVKPEEVMFTSINTSKDGYNSARMAVKRGESEYMSISYEWEGNKIPGFAMDLMGFMKSNNMETSGIWPDKSEDYEEFAAKMKKPSSKKDDMEEDDMEDDVMDGEDEEDSKKKNKKC